MPDKTAHDFSFHRITGQPMPLANFAGKTLLVVNTASVCGFTPQYEGLQKLHEAYGPKGLVVIGVPCNDFGAQEPGDESEIASFCSVNYGVSFPMTQKEMVLGENAHPFYLWAREALGEEQAPKWNFHKYLVSQDGALITAIPTGTDPTDPEVVEQVTAALPA